MQDFLPIVNLYRKVEDILSTYTSPTVACDAGCAHCCHLPVDVTAGEFMTLLNHLLLTCTDKELERVRQAAQVYSDVSARTPEENRAAVRTPCALLVNDRCSAYEVRPLACRGFHSLSVSECVEAFRPENVRKSFPFADARRALVASKASAMLVEACNSAGKDTRTYDLGAALALALAAPDTLRERWDAGEVLLPSVKPA